MKKTVLIIFVMMISAVSLTADTVLLKDGQEFQADVTVFDDFYLSVKLADGREISIPWTEVASIKHTTTMQSWLEETHITAGDSEVGTFVVPLSKDIAFQKALFPGLVIRGAGHNYAKDTNMGTSLLAAEIVSLFMMGLSVSEMLQPQEGSQASVVSQAVFYSGLAIFGGSWLYDLIFSGGAVEKFNRENFSTVQEIKTNEGGAGQ